MLLIDAHEDLAWNMLTFGRDYTLSAVETRRRERSTSIPSHNGDTLLGWPDYQRGKVAVVFATLFAAPWRRRQGPWDIQCYRDSDIANAIYRAQLDAYNRLVEDHPDKFQLVETLLDLESVLDQWKISEKEERRKKGIGYKEIRDREEGGEDADKEEEEEGIGIMGMEAKRREVGLVLLMEGAEGVRDTEELEEWWERGVRIIGPAWAGNRFCGGTHEPGPLTSQGFALLDSMVDLGFVLDLTHMDEKAALQALDYYSGSIIASHSNAAALLKYSETNRFLSDRLIHGLIERGGIIGVVPYNRFLSWGWRPSDGREAVTLHHMVAHIDYICQIAGNARHVGIGTDFDGGFGLQATPAEVDTIADLQKLVLILAEKGYTEEDVAAILGGNWLSLLRNVLPKIR